MAWLSSSTSTALVKVPPTSIPMRYALRSSIAVRASWSRPEMLLACAAIEHLHLAADDRGMGGERLGRASGGGSRLVLEVMEGVDAAHQRGAVARADRLLHGGRDVADGEADAPVGRLVGRRAVRQQHVVQRRLAGRELDRHALALVDLDRDLLAA